MFFSIKKLIEGQLCGPLIPIYCAFQLNYLLFDITVFNLLQLLNNGRLQITLIPYQPPMTKHNLCLLDKLYRINFNFLKFENNLPLDLDNERTKHHNTENVELPHQPPLH